MTLLEINGIKQAEARFRRQSRPPKRHAHGEPLGRNVLINSEVERMFGYDRSELLGQPVEVLVPKDLREQHVSARQNSIKMPTFAKWDLVKISGDFAKMVLAFPLAYLLVLWIQ